MNLPRFLRLGCSILPLLAALADVALPARAADVEHALDELFAAGSKNTPTAIAAAEDSYDALKQQRPGDARIDYAYSVVLINQRRSSEALPLVTKYLQSERPAISAFGVKIWGEIHANRDPDALNTAAAMSERFPLEAAATPTDELTEAAKFLGTVFGYFEFAEREAVDTKLRGERQAQVVKRLGPAYQPAFEEGQGVVVERIEALRTEEQARAAKRKERDKDIAGTARESAADRGESIESLTAGQEQSEKELKAISKELITAQHQYTILAGGVNQLDQMIERERKDKNTNQQRVDRLQDNLREQKKQARAAGRQAEQLQQRAQALQAAVQDRAKRIAKLERLSRADGRRADDAEKRLRGAPRVTGNVADKLASLATYAPFPYQREIERVRGWYSR